MRDNENRASFADAPKVVLDDPLGLVIQRAGRLIENQNSWVGHQRAGDGNALSLSAREGRATLTDGRVISLKQLENEVVGAGELRHLDDLRHRGAGHVDGDVVANRAVEQEVLLQHDAHLPAQPHRIGLLQIDAVDENPTGFRDVEALEQFREGALTRAAAPNDANGGTGCNRARKVAQNFRTVKLIPEADTLEANRTLNSRQAHLAGAQRRFGFGVEQVAESL